MKNKISICIAALAMFGGTFGQEDSEVIKRSGELKQLGNNEIRLNIATALAGLPELNYERYIEDNMGVGIAVAFSLEEAEDMTIRSMILPYYRLYFGKKKASGFFIEGNMAVVGQKEAYDSYYYDNNGNFIVTEVSETSTNFGFGAAIGVKLLSRNGYVGEVYAGGGRLFGETITGGYPRVGICIGKRF